MITVRAHLSDGQSRIEVEGHDQFSIAKEGTLCFAVSVITDSCIAALKCLAEEYPESIQIDIQEEP